MLAAKSGSGWGMPGLSSQTECSDRWPAMRIDRKSMRWVDGVLSP